MYIAEMEMFGKYKEDEGNVDGLVWFFQNHFIANPFEPSLL
jgi:3-hydroxymyristoyl/3-hydroxydecanoyl-(acyl carrier protein) dehydratase